MFNVISLVIYPYDVLVSFGQSDEDLKKDLKKLGVKWEERFSTPADYDGYFTHLKGGGLLRLIDYPKTPKQYGHLQHEIFHAAETCLQYLGFKLTDDSCEAYAYIIGYLTEKIYTKMQTVVT